MRGFRDSFYRFFEGRYGMRALSDAPQFLLAGIYLILVIINFFARSRIINLIEWAFILTTIFRMLSKNIPARENEAQKITALLYRWKEFLHVKKAESQERQHKRAVNQQRKQDKDHVYRECPTCGAVLRLPRRKGKHTVRCPRCGKDFSVKV